MALVWGRAASWQSCCGLRWASQKTPTSPRSPPSSSTCCRNLFSLPSLAHHPAQLAVDMSTMLLTMSLPLALLIQRKEGMACIQMRL